MDREEIDRERDTKRATNELAPRLKDRQKYR